MMYLSETNSRNERFYLSMPGDVVQIENQITKDTYIFGSIVYFNNYLKSDLSEGIEFTELGQEIKEVLLQKRFSFKEDVKKEVFKYLQEKFLNVDLKSYEILPFYSIGYSNKDLEPVYLKMVDLEKSLDSFKKMHLAQHHSFCWGLVEKEERKVYKKREILKISQSFDDLLEYALNK